MKLRSRLLVLHIHGSGLYTITSKISKIKSSTCVNSWLYHQATTSKISILPSDFEQFSCTLLAQPTTSYVLDFVYIKGD
uniref:Uncharacterized protein n=1 Tax=Arundo donax TaxID=35708 RepID=A0A0A9GH70_ARUDO